MLTPSVRNQVPRETAWSERLASARGWPDGYVVAQAYEHLSTGGLNMYNIVIHLSLSLSLSINSLSVYISSTLSYLDLYMPPTRSG